MTLEDPEGHTFWIDETEIVEVFKDADNWVIVSSWGDLYDISDDENPRQICTILEEHQRLHYRDLVD